MVFSSPIFLFAFLPLVLAVHFATPRALRNLMLLVASLFFYAWGETFYVVLLLGSIGMNYAFGLLVERHREGRWGIPLVAMAMVANLAGLWVFKYANFFVDNLNTLFGWAAVEPIALDPVHLPIGISFFTFQTMSYVVDVYRSDARVERNPINVALYVALFPKLVVGPIVRFHDIADQLHERRVSLDGFSLGVKRFIVGLSKKVLVAEVLAGPVNHIFDGVPAEQLTPSLAWLAAIGYTLQIYFDFSGYSDMAIGLGHMFGFRIPENFRHPYASGSITEFWRRWHISLSTWFRDYLYIPLGGNRVASWRVYVNLVTVFFLCGLWHGASWTFVAWGLYHGAFLVIERVGRNRGLPRMPGPLRHGYALVVVTAGWVLFRAADFGQAVDFLSAMAGFSQGDGHTYYPALYMNPETWVTLGIALAFSLPMAPWFEGQVRAALEDPEGQPRSPWLRRLTAALGAGLLLVAFLYCTVHLSASTYSPFIYFRF